MTLDLDRIEWSAGNSKGRCSGTQPKRQSVTQTKLDLLTWDPSRERFNTRVKWASRIRNQRLYPDQALAEKRADLAVKIRQAREALALIPEDDGARYRAEWDRLLRMRGKRDAIREEQERRLRPVPWITGDEVYRTVGIGSAFGSGPSTEAAPGQDPFADE